MDKELTDFLDTFLDNPTNEEIYLDFQEVLQSRTVYSFLYVLHRISYMRIPELLEEINNMIKVKIKNKNKELIENS